MIERILEKTILKKLNKGKVIILMGARQTGKTTLLKNLCKKYKHPLWLDADEPEVKSVLESASVASLKRLFKSKDVVIIDEAQRIKNIGIKLKLCADHIPDIQVIATGSSSFELANEVNEPLTGRKWEYQLHPISYTEMVTNTDLISERSLLHERMIFGYYPEVVNAEKESIPILKSLSDSFLYKDILMWDKIKKPDKVLKLLQALAFQIGNQVSYHELGQIVSLNNETVEKYLVLLEQSYIIFRLPSFSRNLRNELKSSRKIYFYDNGIRNALIANYNSLDMRQDVGALWENFLMAERRKYLDYKQITCNKFFWRNHAQNEIDYIEERNGAIYAYEFKWSEKAKTKFATAFINSYKPKEMNIISKNNFEDFIFMD